MPRGRRGAAGGAGRGRRRAARRRHRRRRRRRMIIGGMVVAGVGYSAYKMTQPQAEQIEQDTGKKLEDLEEEEIDASMEKLGIEAEEPTEEELAQLDAEE